MTVVIDLFNTLRLALLIAPDVFGDIEGLGGVDQQVGPVDKLFGRADGDQAQQRPMGILGI